jgi:hypothetical protein
MSVSVWRGDRFSRPHCVARSLGRRWHRFWRIRTKEAFPALSFAKNLSQDEFAAYLLLVAAHI